MREEGRPNLLRGKFHAYIPILADIMDIPKERVIYFIKAIINYIKMNKQYTQG